MKRNLKKKWVVFMQSLTKLNDLKRRVLSLEAQRDTYSKIVDSLGKENIELSFQMDKINRAVTVLQMIIESRQHGIIELFEKTVTSALQDLFGAGYSFKIELDKRNNVSTAEFKINTGDYKGYIPLKMCQGKALIETVSTILAIMFVVALKKNKLIIMDESLNGIESDRFHDAGMMLRSIAKQFKIQIIMVSHIEPLIRSADRVLRLT